MALAKTVLGLLFVVTCTHVQGVCLSQIPKGGPYTYPTQYKRAKKMTHLGALIALTQRLENLGSTNTRVHK